MYEYKSILLEGYDGQPLEESHCDTLNEEFEKGWEYVNSIVQTLAQGHSSTEYGSVIVILRKNKSDLSL